MLTIREVRELLGGIPESTFYRWRQAGKGPRAVKLPNGAVRIRRSEYDRWVGSLEESA
ncbi:helix-turn-helix transcriptional regulator [Streptomyces sp. CA-250714]|uniref:helix-turn-helix transcriptional regulator n=1 Tax=Streptomyces sp. CA-250714 TaxID=3240060 RepID=UPI003D91414E